MAGAPVFDQVEQAAINLLIREGVGAVPVNRVGSASKSRIKTTTGTVSPLKEDTFRKKRDGAVSRLSTRSLNRVLGRVLASTGLTAIGNIFAGGPAAIAVPFVSAALGFGLATVNMTLEAIEVRKKALGVFKIPSLPTSSSILQSALDGNMGESLNKIVLKASYGKQGLVGGISAITTLVSSILDRQNLDRAMQDAQQDLWRDQPVPHAEVLNAQAILRVRWISQFEAGGDVYGGWKKLSVSGG